MADQCATTTSQLPAHQLPPSSTPPTHIPRPTTTLLWPIGAIPTSESDRKGRGCREKHHNDVFGGFWDFEANQPHFAVESLVSWLSITFLTPNCSFSSRMTTNTKFGVGILNLLSFGGYWEFRGNPTAKCGWNL